MVFAPSSNTEGLDSREVWPALRESSAPRAPRPRPRAPATRRRGAGNRACRNARVPLSRAARRGWQIEQINMVVAVLNAKSHYQVGAPPRARLPARRT